MGEWLTEPIGPGLVSEAHLGPGCARWGHPAPLPSLTAPLSILAPIYRATKCVYEQSESTLVSLWSCACVWSSTQTHCARRQTTRASPSRRVASPRTSGRRALAALARRRARLESVSCSCGGLRCTSGTTPQEVQILRNRARGDRQTPDPNAPCSMLTHQLSLRCSGSLPVVAWAGPAPPPPLARASRSCQLQECPSSAQWPRSQARLSPNLRSPRSSST